MIHFQDFEIESQIARKTLDMSNLLFGEQTPKEIRGSSITITVNLPKMYTQKSYRGIYSLYDFIWVLFCREEKDDLILDILLDVLL